jgi:ABC-type transport system involved in multi-copper enzyme maturation permease subunit
MIAALLKKDWRLNRVVVIAAAVVSMMPYALTLANIRLNPPAYRATEPRDYFDAALTAAYACLVLSVVLSAAFGGLAFAAERRERTAEFLAMMPVSRRTVILSKLLVASACVAALVAVHAVVVAVVVEWAEVSGVRFHSPTWAEAGGMALAFAVALFGIAWALSTVIRSPAIAASIAIAVGIGLLFGGAEWAKKLSDLWWDGRSRPFSEGELFAMVSGGAAAVGVLAVAVSSAYYLRRVEP